jgi:hypothetical protein
METMILILIKVMILISLNPNIPQDTKTEVITEIRQVVEEATKPVKAVEKPIEIVLPVEKPVEVKPVEKPVDVVKSPVVETHEPVIIKTMTYATIGTPYMEDGERLALISLNDSTRALVTWKNEEARETGRIDLKRKGNRDTQVMSFGHIGIFEYRIENYDAQNNLVDTSTGTISITSDM